jgi:hypothetical protein
MGVLRRCDVAKGTAGIAGVVLPLNLVLNIALVLPKTVPMMRAAEGAIFVLVNIVVSPVR